MKRLLGVILCFIALIAQVGIGALPSGDVCFGCTAPSEERTCCCKCDDSSEDESASCCYGGELPSRCDRCVLVKVPDPTATTRARVQLHRDVELPIAAIPCPAAPVVAGVLGCCDGVLPRATESPPDRSPGLVFVRTTHLAL